MTDENPEKWASEWSHDETTHWHACVVSGCTVKNQEGAHTIENGICSVCGYDGSTTSDTHTHVWGDWVKTDPDKHWKPCTVDGCTAKDQEGAHTIENGICSVCGYDGSTTSDTHTHVWGDWVKTDPNKHWKPCTVKDCKEKYQEGAHTIENGVCSVCGYDGSTTSDTHTHVWGDWVKTDPDKHWKPCTDDKCTAKDQEGAHNFVNNVCSVCGYKKSTTIGGDPEKPSNPSNPDLDLDKDITEAGLVEAVKEQIKKKEDSFMGIYYDNSSNSTLVSDIFSAIKGKNKACLVASDGERLKWVFYGEKIINPKNVNLKVDISSLKSTNSANKNKISRLVGNANTCVLSFAHNGDLPGETKIRVDMDSVFPNTTQKYFWVYHFTENELDLIAEKVSAKSDGYLEFWISHNSDYIITDREIPRTRPSNRDSDDGTRLSEVSTSNSSGTSGKSNPHTGGY